MPSQAKSATSGRRPPPRRRTASRSSSADRWGALLPPFPQPPAPPTHTTRLPIVFFKPQGEHTYIRAEEACPKETSGQHLYTSLTDGYCFLYPDGFNADNGMAGRIEGGPVLGKVEDFGDVRTSLTLGTFGYFPKGLFRGPTFWDLAMSLTKRQNLTEQVSVEFRSILG